MKEKKKISKETIAWWIYLLLAVILVFFGLKDSEAAQRLLITLRDVFTLLIN